ncbi:MAG TPA: hypothetical protein VGL49_01870 [Acidimicrobiales bacterium]
MQQCESTGATAYSFQCPACRVMVNKAANERVVAALTGVGVAVTRWSLPAELAEVKIGPPITHDDLLSFHLAMRGDTWEKELAGLRRTT